MADSNVIISEANTETESNIIPLVEKTGGGVNDVLIGEQLTPTQKEQTRRLLTEYKDVT